MSRNPLIEAIHEARYDLQTCAEKDKPAARKKLYELLDQAACRAASSFRPEEILDALYDGYKEFRRAKRRQEWPRIWCQEQDGREARYLGLSVMRHF